jgi:hypothetical protein
MDWQLVAEGEGDPFSGGRFEAARERPRGHSYTAGVMRQAIELVVKANCSFRGAARALEICTGESEGSCPSLWSVRNWILRLGLFELKRPKERGDDWVWILDHTIQIGSHKALLILGVRLDRLAHRDFTLGHQDVAVLGLDLCERSNGERILGTLERLAEEVGEPRELVSDAGSDIKKAVELFCDQHGPTDWIPDVSHRMARVLESELKGDPQWEGFLSEVAWCRNRCQQTPLSPLLPPGQRSKARWMSCKPILTWAVKLLENPVPEWADRRQFAGLFGWLNGYRDLVQECWLMVHMGEEICRILKQGGIASGPLEECRQTLEEMSTSPRLRRQAQGIRPYLDEVESKLRPGERLLGSSDLIESIFGKYKLLVERSPHPAMSRLILAIGSLISERTPALIRRAMETVSLKSVEEWFGQSIGHTSCSRRRTALV